MALHAGVQVDDYEDIAYLDDPSVNVTLRYVFRKALQPPAIPEEAEP